MLRAVERDLRRQYREPSALQQHSEPVGILLVDLRMPHKNGIETVREAIKLYQDAKLVLLTAYADTDAVIKAINEVRLNHYLLKPWAPGAQPLSRARRSSRRIAGKLSAGFRRTALPRHPLVSEGARNPRIPCAQPGPASAARRVPTPATKSATPTSHQIDTLRRII